MATVKMNTSVAKANTTPTIVRGQNDSSIDKLFFAPVKKVAAKDLFPGFEFNSYNDTVIKVTVNGYDKIVNNCSSNYLLLPNAEFFPNLETQLKSLGEFTAKREIKNGAEFSVDYDFISPERKLQIVGKDVVFPRISVSNSYNSKNLFSVEGGFFRVVCSNGLCLPVADSTFNTILSHTEGNLQKIVASTFNGIAAFLEKTKEIAGGYEILLEKKIPKGELDEVVEKVLRSSKTLISYKDKIIERIQKENQTEGVELNLFSLYNGINYFLQPEHNPTLTADHASRMNSDIKVFDYIYSLVG